MKNGQNKNVKIRSIEAKDLIKDDYKTEKYIGSLDYSIETDYIEENLKGVIYIKDDGRKYCDDIMTVTFDYSLELENKYKEIPYVPTLEESKDIAAFIEWNEKYKKEHVELLSNYKEEQQEVKQKKKETRKKIINEFNKSNDDLYDKYKSSIVAKSKATKAKKKITFDKELEYEDIKSEYKSKLKEYIDDNVEFQALINRFEEVNNNLSNLKRNKKKKLREIKNSYFKSTKQLRYDLYKNGFDFDGKHYVRYKRSSGSARVGKCLFINEKYYKEMIDWSFAGIDIENKEIDIAGMEAYISLPLTSSIGRFELDPKNILIIEDYYSIFNEVVMATRFIDDKLVTKEENVKIKNNIFDGESLLDTSIFENNNDLPELKFKATTQIRNKFFKGQGVRCDLQKFYKNHFGDRYETATVKDMFGNQILVKDILLVTTPSSVKYLKYGTFEEWKKQIKNVKWAICKYEKPQHHFNGMAQTHYQLLNGSGMTEEDMEKFLEPTIKYINLLKDNDSVFKNYVKLKCNFEEEINEEEVDLDEITETEEDKEQEYTINSTSDLIYAILTMNSDFINSEICKEFRKDVIDNYIKNVRKGHVLVNGNYSVVANNIVEMLYASVGMLVECKDEKGEIRLQIKDKPEVKLVGYEAISNKFYKGEEFMGVRSPQPTMCNVGVYKNKKYPNNAYYKELKEYFNVKSKEIIFTNSINVNKMEKFSSEDFDIDAELISNNPLLLEYAKRLQIFKVSNDLTPKKPEPKVRNNKNLAMTDILCSSNKIGEIINLIQSLNSFYWDKISRGSNHEDDDIKELYKDISNLNVLSCIEIDRCKKLSPVNANKELKKIRKKDYLKGYKPYFFKYCNEFKVKDAKKPKYKRFNCGMDYLQEILDENIKYSDRRTNWGLSSFVKPKPEHNSIKRNYVKDVITEINEVIKEVNIIYKSDIVNKYELATERENKCADIIKNKLKNRSNILAIIYNCIRYLDLRNNLKAEQRNLKNATKQLDSNILKLEKCKSEFRKREIGQEIKKLKKEINRSTKEIKRLEKRLKTEENYKYSRKILKLLFKANQKEFLKCFKTTKAKDFITEIDAKDIEKTPYITLYGVEFKKIC